MVSVRSYVLRCEARATTLNIVVPHPGSRHYNSFKLVAHRPGWHSQMLQLEAKLRNPSLI